MTTTPESADVSGDCSEATPGPWRAYFTVHGDPYVVPSARPYPTSAIATVSTAPDDYGRANALLLAAAPDLLAMLRRCADAFANARPSMLDGEPLSGYVAVHVTEAFAAEVIAAAQNNGSSVPSENG